MDILLDVLIGLSMLAVVGSLFMGMIAFSKNDPGDRSNGWMVWRVRMQVIAVAVLMLSVWLRSSHAG
jgi:hypothetical protein